MRVVVLADTHMPRSAKALPESVLKDIERSDLVVHLGDFTDMELVHHLRALAPLAAVHGNNDSSEIRTLLPATERFSIGRFRVTALHGHLGGQTALQAARRVTGSDIVLFGHSHAPVCTFVAGTLLFNPGSPTDRRWGRPPSYGILDIDDDIDPHIVHPTD